MLFRRTRHLVRPFGKAAGGVGLAALAAFIPLTALPSCGSNPAGVDPTPAPASAKESRTPPERESARPSSNPAPSAASSPAPSASSSPGPAPSSAKRRYVVAAIGDSLTDARSHGGKYLDYLKERCPESRFDNYGKGGQMVNQMRKRFAQDVLGEPAAPGAPKPSYTHVIVFGGVNDLYSDLTAKRTPHLIEQDLTLMYQAAKRRGAQVVAITVAPWGGFTSYYNASRAATTLELNQWILAQKQAGAVDHVIDAYPLLSCGDPERICPQFMPPFKDGLHFNADGHKKLGEALHNQVFSSCL